MNYEEARQALKSGKKITIKGNVDVIIDDGKESKVVTTLEEGKSFGETALITDAPRNATCIARTDCTLYSLGKAAFKKSVDETTPFVQQILRSMAQR